MELTKKSINVIHLLLIGPFLVYVGLQGKKCNPLCFKLMVVVGLLVVALHGYSLYKSMDEQVTLAKLGGAIKNTVGDVRNQVIGKDDNGNHVMVDEKNNVTVVDNNGNVVAQNNAVAKESANQAMNNANNKANNNANNVM